MSTRTLDELGAALYGGGGAPPAPAEPPAQPADSAPRLRTEAELGEALYGKPAPAPELRPPSDEPPQPRTFEQIAEAHYQKDEPVPLDPAPPAVEQLRDDVARRMYPAQVTFAEVAPDTDFKAQGIEPETGRKAMAEMREMFADLELAPQDVQSLRRRAERLRDAPIGATAQQQAANEALNREFGPAAAQALQVARLLVARDPRVAKLIDHMGLGDDPETVVMLARKARSQILAGKLRRKGP